LFYLLRQNAGAPATELRVIEPASGRAQQLLPGISITDYDISADETAVAFTTPGNDGEPQVWVAPLDRRTPPRLISRAADQPSFGPAGDIFIRSLEGSANAVIRIDQDGGGRTRMSSPAFQEKGAMSPDGRWVIVFGPSGGGQDAVAATWAVPVGGGTPRLICVPYCGTAWSADGRFFYVAVSQSVTTGVASRTIAIPVAEGESWPELPTTGINAVGEPVLIEGAVVIEHGSISPGPDPSVYAFTKSELHRNLFRIPLH
jgi:Tol biopolymer transport system component